MNTFPRKAYPLSVVMHFLNPDGTPYSIDGLGYSLRYRTGRGEKIVDSSVLSADGSALTWTLPVSDQEFTGTYTVLVNLQTSRREICKVRFENAFALVDQRSGLPDQEEISASSAYAVDLFAVGKYDYFSSGSAANDAAVEAAVQKANAAMDQATTANQTAEAATGMATTALASAESANTVANNALTAANAASETAEAASEIATTANQTAEAATATATTALASANTANQKVSEAFAAANTATATANTALDQVASAVSTANSAKDAALSAATAASTALTAANAATAAAGTVSDRFDGLKDGLKGELADLSTRVDEIVVGEGFGGVEIKEDREGLYFIDKYGNVIASINEDGVSSINIPIMVEVSEEEYEI